MTPRERVLSVYNTLFEKFKGGHGECGCVKKCTRIKYNAYNLELD
jgi:hypothetical protein